MQLSLVSVKSTVKILQFFVAFLENMNFTLAYLILTFLLILIIPMGATMNFSRTRPIVKKGRLKDEILVYMAIKSR